MEMTANVPAQAGQTVSEKKDSRRKSLFIAGGLIGMYALLQTAGATGGEEEFGEIYDKISEWSQGTLGKLMALICIVVGTAYTISRGTLIYAIIGLAMCLVLYNAPTIIDNMMGAALPVEAVFPDVPISNGLLR